MSTPVVQAVRPVVLGVALAALVGVGSGQVKSTAKAMTLTPMDYIEIRQPSSTTARTARRARCFSAVTMKTRT